MVQKSLAGAVRVKLRAEARFDVVIHFDIAGSVLLHQSADDPVGILPHVRIAEIQLIPAPVKDPPAVTNEEPVVRHFLRNRTVDSHHLKFEPESRNHSFAPDIIRQLPDTFRKAFPAFLPLADAGPPFARRIPAGVDHIVLASALCCGVDHRDLLFGGRVSVQAVHIVIEDDGQLLVVPVRSADQAAVGRQIPHGAGKVIPPCAHGNGNAFKAFSRLQIDGPVTFLLCRSADAQIKMLVHVTDFVMP